MDEILATGRYHTRDELLREGVLLVAEREKLRAELEAKIAKSLEAGAAGEVRPAHEALVELRDRYAAMDRKRA